MERVILRQPPDSYSKDSLGQLIKKACKAGETPEDNACVAVRNASASDFVARDAKTYTDWVVYPRREDRGGKQGIFADIMSGNWQTRFDITRFAALDKLNEDWSITDVDGRDWDIESVVSGTESSGRLMWKVYCVRRKTK